MNTQQSAALLALTTAVGRDLPCKDELMAQGVNLDDYERGVYSAVEIIDRRIRALASPAPTDAGVLREALQQIVDFDGNASTPVHTAVKLRGIARAALAATPAAAIFDHLSRNREAIVARLEQEPDVEQTPAAGGDGQMDAETWAELHRLRAERTCSDGRTWQEVAVDEKMKRLAVEQSRVQDSGAERLRMDARMADADDGKMVPLSSDVEANVSNAAEHFLCASPEPVKKTEESMQDDTPDTPEEAAMFDIGRNAWAGVPDNWVSEIRGHEADATPGQGAECRHLWSIPGADNTQECAFCGAIREAAGLSFEEAMAYEGVPANIRKAVLSLTVTPNNKQPAKPEAADVAYESWHVAVIEADEIYSNSTDERIKSRAKRVLAWIEKHKPEAGAQAVSKNRATNSPGGMECEDCGCIFIGDESHDVCGICHAKQTADTQAGQGALGDEVRNTLAGIAFANRRNKDVFDDDAAFVDWAQSIAKHVINKYAGHGEANPCTDSDGHAFPRSGSPCLYCEATPPPTRSTTERLPNTFPLPGEPIGKRPARSSDEANAIFMAYKTWPEDIRKKLSVHDLRRMGGWTPRTQAGDWRIDDSAGRPILVYENCSVIEAEQARYVLSLIAKEATPPPARSSDEADTARLDWIESQVWQYGDGRTEPNEAGWAIQWQQQKPDDHWPGLRAWIDEERGREVAGDVM